MKLSKLSKSTPSVVITCVVYVFLCACICLPRGPVYGICINLVWNDEHFNLECLLLCYFMPEPGALLALCMLIHLLAQKWKWILCPITLTPSQVCCAFNQFGRNYMKLHKSGFLCWIVSLRYFFFLVEISINNMSENLSLLPEILIGWEWVCQIKVHDTIYQFVDATVKTYK